MKPVFAGLLLAGGMIGAVAGRWLTQEAGETNQSASSEAVAAKKTASAGLAGSAAPGWLPSFPEHATELPRVAIEPVDTRASASFNMATARINGDPRTPPLVRDTQSQVSPTPAELADPQAYARFEANQNTRLLSAFVDAAAVEAPQLRADIERGRENGIPADKIAIAQEKLRLIEEMSRNVQAEHPEIAKK